MRRSFCDLTLDDLVALRPPGSPGHLLGKLQRVASWANGAPVLGKELRAFVDERLDLALPELVAREISTDGATKLLFRLHDGATIETVHMPRAVKNPRVTLCLSSQVGCAMGCTFCRTASMGLVRNLTAAEIVGQVLATLRLLGPAETQRVSLVFMGMGEPLHNLDAVLRAITVLCDSAGLGLPAMRISVSTAGLLPGIVRLAAVPTAVRPCLALSVNATTDSKRSLTMPITKRHGLAELRAALEVFPLRAHEKLTLEYVLLAGDNDSPEDAARLAAFAQGLRHVVNVIPWNGFAEGAFRAPDDEAVQTFARALMGAGCFVTVRKSRGRDVAGACGQLATEARRAPRRLLG